MVPFPAPRVMGAVTHFSATAIQTRQPAERRTRPDMRSLHGSPPVSRHAAPSTGATDREI